MCNRESIAVCVTLDATWYSCSLRGHSCFQLSSGLGCDFRVKPKTMAAIHSSLSTGIFCATFDWEVNLLAGWICLMQSQVIGPSWSVLSIPPGGRLPGDARNWTRDFLLAKCILYHWAVTPSCCSLSDSSPIILSVCYSTELASLEVSWRNQGTTVSARSSEASVSWQAL